jgi:serine/threonine protein kinase
VLVTDDARIFLIDFGLCHIDDGNRVTVTDEAVGTPQYQPPECTGYSPTPPTFKSDLYSAGKLLWSMVTNRAAFAREQPVFNELSLVNMLPHVKQSWHLFHIFEQTIRHDPRQRFPNTANALQTATWVRTLIADNMKPLEQLTVDTCPLCGIGRYPNVIQLHVRFNAEIDNFYKLLEPVKGSYAVCPYCFHTSFVAVEALQKRLDERKQLQ